MKIYVMTDMEGCAGILNHDDWVVPSGRYYLAGRELLTREVNAAVEGFLEGGATSILVVDGHGAGGIDPQLLHPAAELAAGVPSPVYPFFLDASFDGAAWVGQHAKAGTPCSHITHTQTFDYIDLAVNGLSIGEYGELALCAMELGVPSILACGEEALAREAEALTPGIVTVAVKRGILPDGLERLDRAAYGKSKLTAVHRAPEKARAMIREGARFAIDKLRSRRASFEYPSIRAPFVVERLLRKGLDAPPLRQRAEHKSSFIAALNTSWTNVQ